MGGESFVHRDDCEQRGRDQGFCGETVVLFIIFFKFLNKLIYDHKWHKTRNLQEWLELKGPWFFPLNTPK